MRILIVEDDFDIRGTLALLLENEGHTATWAHDGYEALEHLRLVDKLPDLIILDLAMPTMNGFEFREQQLREDKICDIPVICVSAMHWCAWMKDKLGADGYLPKPFKLERILEYVEQFKPNGR